MVDWNNGKPNPRFWVLKLLHDNFGPGDKVVQFAPSVPPAPPNPYIYALAVVTKNGKRRVLLANKRDRTFVLTIPGASGGQMELVDEITGFDPPKIVRLDSDNVTLNGFGVAAITLPEPAN